MKTLRTSLFSRRTLLIAGVLVLVMVLVVLFGGQRWIGSRIENHLRDELQKRGVVMQRENASWDPWRGLHLTHLQFRHRDGGQRPIAELANLNLRIPFSQYFGSQSRITHWRISNSSATFHDSVGSIALDDFSLRLTAGSGEIEVKNIAARKDGLTAKLKGMIKTPSTQSSDPIRLDLSAVRATLATLDVRAGTGPFHVTGKFHVDAGATWSATLDGKGGDLEWKGIRWTKAAAQAQLASSDSTIHYALSTRHGSSEGTVSAADWETAPVNFIGTLKDAQGQRDEYRGNYQKQVFTVESLKGRADLWALSADVPAASVAAPDKVKFTTFPLIDARNIRYDSRAEPPRWTVGSVSIGSPDPVVFKADDRQLEAKDLSATASYDGDDWILKNADMKILGGSLSLQGRYRDGALHKARGEIRNIPVSELRQLFGGKAGKASAGIVSADYRGSVDFAKKMWEGTGSMHMANAPVIEVPLLDQVFELFAAIIPEVQRPEEGQFDAEFKVRPDIIHVTRFEAKGGSSLTVSATGTVDLDKKRVAGRARGKLVGLPGLVTSPLSRLLEMEVSGPYDNIRVKPLGPARLASNTVSGTVGVAVDTIEEAGKITGTVITEGLKVPFKLFGMDPPEDENSDR